MRAFICDTIKRDCPGHQFKKKNKKKQKTSENCAAANEDWMS